MELKYAMGELGIRQYHVIATDRGAGYYAEELNQWAKMGYHAIFSNVVQYGEGIGEFLWIAVMEK